MAAGCPAKCAKFLLIAFNIIFWLSGAALLAVGIWMLVDDKIFSYLNLVSSGDQGSFFKYAAYTLIAVGSFVFVTGFAGCCGAIKESPCLLGTYIFLLVIVMLGEIAAGVLGFIFRNQISDLIKKNLMDDIETKNFTMGKDSDGKIIYTDIGKNLNLFQEEFHCCGLNNSSDYTKLTDKDVFVKKIPYSCYKLNDEKKKITMPQFTDVDLKKLNNKGCKDELIKWFEDNTIILIGIAIGIACLEIFGVIFAVCLCRNPSREEYQ